MATLLRPFPVSSSLSSLQLLYHKSYPVRGCEKIKGEDGKAGTGVNMFALIKISPSRHHAGPWGQNCAQGRVLASMELPSSWKRDRSLQPTPAWGSSDGEVGVWIETEVQVHIEDSVDLLYGYLLAVLLHYHREPQLRTAVSGEKTSERKRG